MFDAGREQDWLLNALSRRRVNNRSVRHPDKRPHKNDVRTAAQAIISGAGIIVLVLMMSLRVRIRSEVANG